MVKFFSLRLLGLIEKLSGLPTMAAEDDSVQKLLICQDVTIGEGDRQFSKSSGLVGRVFI
jgi:hypothetical protein